MTSGEKHSVAEDGRLTQEEIQALLGGHEGGMDAERAEDQKFGTVAIHHTNAELAKLEAEKKKAENREGYAKRKEQKQDKTASDNEGEVVDAWIDDGGGEPVKVKVSTMSLDREGVSEKTKQVLEAEGKEFDPNAQVEEQKELAREEAERMKAERIEKILDGRAPEVAAREMTQDIEKLQRELESLKNERYLDRDLREVQKKWIEDVTGGLESLMARREEIMGAMSEAEQEAALYAPSEDSPVNGDFDDLGEADQNTANKMRAAAFDQVLDTLKGAGSGYDALRAQLEEAKQKLEAQDENEDLFAEDESEEKSENEGESRHDAYWRAMKEMASEAQPGHLMSEEERAELLGQETAVEAHEKRESLVHRLRERLHNRIGFRRPLLKTVRKVGVVLMLGLALYGVAAKSAQAAGGIGTVHAASEDFNDDRNVVIGGALGNNLGAQLANAEVAQAGIEAAEIGAEAQAEAQELAQKLGITAEDLMNSGDIDLSNRAEIGDAIYEGYMEREGSEMAENGVMMNFTEWHLENDDNGTKHYGRSLSYIMDMKEGREKTAAQKMLEVIRDQPQALAGFVSNHPQIMKECGIGDDIIKNDNIEQRGQDILDLLKGEKGASLQKELVGASAIALFNENTTFEFYKEYGLERTSYSTGEDGGAPNAESLKLTYDTKQRNGDAQMQIVFTYTDGTKSSSDQNLGCGGQNDVELDGKPRSVVVIAETPEEVPEEAPEDEETPPENEDKPNGEEPDEEEPDEEKPDEEESEPEPEPEPEPDEEEPDEPEPEPGPEEVKTKDPENIQNTVDEGIEDANLGDVNIDQTSPEEITKDTITEQPEINEGNLSGLTDDELRELVDGILKR